MIIQKFFLIYYLFISIVKKTKLFDENEQVKMFSFSCLMTFPLARKIAPKKVNEIFFLNLNDNGLDNRF